MARPASAFTVCYRSTVDGAWVPFMGFTRTELADAVGTARRMAHGNALKSPWALKRGNKIILRIPQGAKA